MKSPLIAYVGWLLLAAAVSFYGYGIYLAAKLTLCEKSIGANDFPKIISGTVSTIQSLLLTNLGVLLGVSFVNPDSAIARQLLFSANNNQGRALVNPLQLKDKLQLAAVIIYIVALIVCMVVWIIKDFSEDSTQVVPVIFESGKMFIGVFIGYITAVLTTRTPTTTPPAPAPAPIAPPAPVQQ